MGEVYTCNQRDLSKLSIWSCSSSQHSTLVLFVVSFVLAQLWSSQDSEWVRSAQSSWLPLHFAPRDERSHQARPHKDNRSNKCPGLIASSREADAGPREILPSVCQQLRTTIKPLKRGGRSLAAAGLTQSIMSIPCTFYKLVWSSAQLREVPCTCFIPAIRFCHVLFLFSCVLWIYKHISQAVSHQVKPERKYILSLIVCQKAFSQTPFDTNYVLSRREAPCL